MYIPVASAGYFVFGDAVQDNILQSLPPGGLRLTAEILIVVHLVFAFNIMFNPVTQDVEGFLNIPLSKYQPWNCDLRKREYNFHTYFWTCNILHVKKSVLLKLSKIYIGLGDSMKSAEQESIIGLISFTFKNPNYWALQSIQWILTFIAESNTYNKMQIIQITSLQ